MHICDVADTCAEKFEHVWRGNRRPRQECAGGKEDHHQRERKFVGYVTLSIKIFTAAFSLDLFRSLHNN